MLASLIALFLAPPLWRKAVKVTTRRLLQKSPRMMSEGQADRDQMRAEFAIATAKMEAKIEQLKEASDTQLIELSATEKKREQLLKKIKSLEKTAENREKSIEKLNKRIEHLEAEASQKGFSTKHAGNLNAQATALEAQAYELDLHKQKIAQLTKKLETRSKTAAVLKQEVGMSRERITKLIRKIDAKDQQIAQLTGNIAALNSPGTSPSDKSARDHGTNKIPLIMTSAKQSCKPAKPLAPIVINSSASTPSPNGLEPNTKSTPHAETGISQPAHAKQRPEKKVNPAKTPESLSLAQRIRALQEENPKPV